MKFDQFFAKFLEAVLITVYFWLKVANFSLKMIFGRFLADFFETALIGVFLN